MGSSWQELGAGSSSGTPMADKLDDDLPPLAELRSPDKRTHDHAWNLAYPLLWKRGIGVAEKRMFGSHLEPDRQEVVAMAIQQFHTAVLAGEADDEQTWEKLFPNET